MEPKRAQSEPPASGSGFLPLVLGGVIAGAIGFMVAELDLIGGDDDAEITRLQSELSRQSEKITALENAPVQTPDVDLSAVDALQGTVTDLQATLAALDTRLTEVEKRPITGGTSEAAIAAYERELAKLQESFATQRGEIETLLENAMAERQASEETAQNAAALAALTEVRSAIDAGQPFADELATLSGLLDTQVPETLAATADTGVPTLVSLQADFPDAARVGLADARAAGADTGEQGFGGFLRRQLGARSVAPREGTDPDAVLSRAEQAVKEGRLTDALAELEALPEASRLAMSDWLAGAEARNSAIEAANTLADRLTAN